MCTISFAPIRPAAARSSLRAEFARSVVQIAAHVVRLCQPMDVPANFVGKADAASRTAQPLRK